MFGSKAYLDLRNRFLFLLAVLVFYRFGTFIPIPGVDVTVVKDLADAHAGGVLGMFNVLTGGALGRLSVFALNIMPYITASIIMQLMGILSSEIGALKKNGGAGRKKINQYTRYLTIFLALVQGYGIASGIESMTAHSGSVVLHPGYFFRIVAAISLATGSVIVMWCAEQINIRGIGNGSSLIIFAGIVSGMPGGIASLFEMGKTGAISGVAIAVMVLLVCLMLVVVIYAERAQRRIVVSYPKRQVGQKLYGGDSTHIPLRINSAGVIPAIFASSLLLFPVTIAGFIPGDSQSSMREFVYMHLSHGKPLYMMLYVVFIAFFCFFYAGIVFNAEETAENIKKQGGVVLGRRPGEQTAKYFKHVLDRLTVLGAVYMSAVCVLPEVLMSRFAIPFYLGGTSVLIVVNVVMDLYVQVQSQMFASQYASLMKRARNVMGR